MNAAGVVFSWTGSAWQGMVGNLRQVAVGSGVRVWGVAGDGSVHRWNGSAWDRVDGVLKNIAVGADGEVWGVNAAGQVFRWTGSAWDGSTGTLAQIAVGGTGDVWGINAAQQIWQLDVAAWIGTMTARHVLTSDQQLQVMRAQTVQVRRMTTLLETVARNQGVLADMLGRVCKSLSTEVVSSARQLNASIPDAGPLATGITTWHPAATQDASFRLTLHDE